MIIDLLVAIFIITALTFVFGNIIAALPDKYIDKLINWIIKF